jgi:GxxExxY protein
VPRLCSRFQHRGHGGHRGHGEENIGAIAVEITDQAIRLGIKVHRRLGPGLLESIYEECLFWELERSGMAAQRQVVFPLVYEELQFKRAYRADIVIESAVILEIKPVERLLPIHESQMLTYLRLSGCRVGLLVNFNSVLLKDGLKRLIL